MNKIVFMSLILISVGSCAHNAQKKSSDDSAKVAAAVGGTHYATIEFEKGSSKLTPISQQNLNALAARANQDGREIEEIKVLAWADKEYPEKVDKNPNTKDVILAKERAKSIESYLEEDLHNGTEIESFNMAKRPNLLSKLVKGDDYAVKEAFERSGATSTKLDDGSTSYSKASRAIVIIDFDNDKKDI